MPVRSFILSLILHLLVLGLMLFQIKFGEEQTPKKITPALMIIDLTKVKLADQTNLPQKVKKEKKSPKAVTKETPKPKEKSKISSKKETPKKENKTPVVKTPPKKPKEMPKPIPQKPVKEAVAVKPKSDKPKTTKVQNKTEKPTPKPSAKPKQTVQENTMDSLLKSVRKIQKPLDQISQTLDEELPPITDGIEGGTGGSLSRILTISEQDLIANQLRKCWNVNAGVAGIDDMIVEISATVGRDGRIRTVKINNMKPDSAFRTTAESAQRAVWICDKREDSPFKILSEKYGSQYDSWKELFLRFNPMDNSIF